MEDTEIPSKALQLERLEIMFTQLREAVNKSEPFIVHASIQDTPNERYKYLNFGVGGSRAMLGNFVNEAINRFQKLFGPL